MHFVISCRDKPGQPERRPANRADHLAYLERHADRILVAGPTLDEADGTPTGSLLIMDFDDVDAARAFADADPYNRAGVFERVTVEPWKKVFPGE